MAIGVKMGEAMTLRIKADSLTRRLYNILQQCPYHVDTHMQLSEMQTQQGDLGESLRRRSNKSMRKS